MTRHLIESAKLIALFGAVAFVVWSMPDASDAGMTEAAQVANPVTRPAASSPAR